MYPFSDSLFVVIQVDDNKSKERKQITKEVEESNSTDATEPTAATITKPDTVAEPSVTQETVEPTAKASLRKSKAELTKENKSTTENVDSIENCTG